MPYFGYYRVYKFYLSKWFYEKQDCVLVAKGLNAPRPIIGNLIPVLRAVSKNMREGTNKSHLSTLYEITAGNWTPVWLVYHPVHEAGLIISDPTIVEAMYTTKNKYFDKHPIIKELSYCLTGDSILFSETSSEWRARRKTVSPAFYKGKLLKMIEIARESVKITLNHFQGLIKESKEPKTRINLINELSDMTVRILLMCALGEDVSQ